MRFLVDTDVLIEILRRNGAVMDQLSALHHAGHVLLYSPLTVAELRAGVRAGEELALAQLLASMTCVSIDAFTGERAGEYLKQYRRSHGLQIADALISASAVEADAEFITFNQRHFPMPELVLHNLSRSAAE